jgi:hypothetical protein
MNILSILEISLYPYTVNININININFYNNNFIQNILMLESIFILYIMNKLINC